MFGRGQKPIKKAEKLLTSLDKAEVKIGMAIKENGLEYEYRHAWRETRNYPASIAIRKLVDCNYLPFSTSDNKRIPHAWAKTAEKGMVMGLYVLKNSFPRTDFGTFAKGEADRLDQLKQGLPKEYYDLEEFLEGEGGGYAESLSYHPAKKSLITMQVQKEDRVDKLIGGNIDERVTELYANSVGYMISSGRERIYAEHDLTGLANLLADPNLHLNDSILNGIIDD